MPRRSYTTLGIFSPSDVIPFSTEHQSFKTYACGGKSWQVKMNSQRYLTFKNKGCSCVCCGVKGAEMRLQYSNETSINKPHFNLYTPSGILMTKDHIIPTARGGEDNLNNYQPMCEKCNEIKQDGILKNSSLLLIKKVKNDIPFIRKKDMNLLIIDLRYYFESGLLPENKTYILRIVYALWKKLNKPTTSKEFKIRFKNLFNHQYWIFFEHQAGIFIYSMKIIDQAKQDMIVFINKNQHLDKAQLAQKSREKWKNMYSTLFFSVLKNKELKSDIFLKLIGEISNENLSNESSWL